MALSPSASSGQALVRERESEKPLCQKGFRSKPADNYSRFAASIRLQRLIHLGQPLAFFGGYSSLFPDGVWLRFVIPTLFSVIPTEVEGSRAARRDLSAFSTLRSSPFRVNPLDQGDLFLPRPSLELLLSINCGSDVAGVLAIHPPRDPILAREPGDQAVLVLVTRRARSLVYACKGFLSGLPLCTR